MSFFNWFLKTGNSLGQSQLPHQPQQPIYFVVPTPAGRVEVSREYSLPVKKVFTLSVFEGICGILAMLMQVSGAALLVFTTDLCVTFNIMAFTTSVNKRCHSA